MNIMMAIQGEKKGERESTQQKPLRSKRPQCFSCIYLEICILAPLSESVAAPPRRPGIAYVTRQMTHERRVAPPSDMVRSSAEGLSTSLVCSGYLYSSRVSGLRKGIFHTPDNLILHSFLSEIKVLNCNLTVRRFG